MNSTPNILLVIRLSLLTVNNLNKIAFAYSRVKIKPCCALTKDLNPAGTNKVQFTVSREWLEAYFVWGAFTRSSSSRMSGGASGSGAICCGWLFSFKTWRITITGIRIILSSIPLFSASRKRKNYQWTTRLSIL